MKPFSFKKHWSLYIIIPIVLLTIAVRYTSPLGGGDIWWHLLYGKYFIANFTLVPDHTIFSWTPATAKTIYCTWFADIILYTIHSAAGIPGLLVFRSLCVIFFVFAVLSYARQLDILSHPFAWLLCLLGSLISLTAIICKPEIFTFIFMILLCWNWWYLRSNQDKLLNYYFFPLIILIWVNSHGGVVFGYCFLFLIALGELLNSFLRLEHLSSYARKHFFTSLFLSLLALICTPYGLEYPKQIFFSLLPTQENFTYNSFIVAYVSPFSITSFRLDFGKLAYLIIAILFIATFPLIKRRQVDASFLLTNIFFAFLYTVYLRTTFYWAPVAVFSTLYIIGKRPISLFPNNKFSQLAVNGLAILSCLFISFNSIADSLYSPSAYSWFGTGRGNFSPFHEAEFIKQNYSGYNIANTYNQGSYLLWHLWPENKVMIDARHFPYRSWSWELFEFETTPSEHPSFMKKYPADIWCVSHGSMPLYMYLIRQPEWHLVFYGNSASVFVHKELVKKSYLGESNQAALEDTQSSYAALNAYNFSVYIKDWEGAGILVKRMQDILGEKKGEGVSGGASLFLQANQAYYKKDYPLAISLLQKKEVMTHFPSDTMLADALSFSALEKWQAQEDQQALELTQKAVLTNPTLITLFNFGMVQGYLLSPTHAVSPSDQVEDAAWQKCLRKAIELSMNIDGSKQLRDLALAMLNGELQDRPPIVIPQQID